MEAGVDPRESEDGLNATVSATLLRFVDSLEGH